MREAKFDGNLTTTFKVMVKNCWRTFVNIWSGLYAIARKKSQINFILPIFIEGCVY